MQSLSLYRPYLFIRIMHTAKPYDILSLNSAQLSMDLDSLIHCWLMYAYEFVGDALCREDSPRPKYKKETMIRRECARQQSVYYEI